MPYFLGMNPNPDPLIIAKLLGVRAVDYCAVLDVTAEWARQLARDPRHSQRVLIAVLQAALKREQLDFSISGERG